MHCTMRKERLIKVLSGSKITSYLRQEQFIYDLEEVNKKMDRLRILNQHLQEVLRFSVNEAEAEIDLVMKALLHS